MPSGSSSIVKESGTPTSVVRETVKDTPGRTPAKELLERSTARPSTKAVAFEAVDNWERPVKPATEVESPVMAKSAPVSSPARTSCQEGEVSVPALITVAVTSSPAAELMAAAMPFMLSEPASTSAL